MEAFFASRQHDASSPTNLFETYVQYKKDTRAIVAWLTSHAPSRRDLPSRLSVRDLLKIADTIACKAVSMPEIVGFHFRQAIAARTYLTKVFRKASADKGWDVDTENHEFFTSSLTKIYADLCACCAKPKDDCDHYYRCEQECNDRLHQCSNRYGALQSDCENDALLDRGQEPSRQDVFPEPGGHGKKSSEDDQCPSIVDDGLSNTLELYHNIHVFDKVFSAVVDVWKDAAEGTTHILSATAVTNTAYALLERVEHDLTTFREIADPSDLNRAFQDMRSGFDNNSEEMAENSKPAAQNHVVSDLHESWQSVLALQSKNPTPASIGSLVATPLAPHINLRVGPNALEADNECRRMLLANIATLLISDRQKNGFIRHGSPVYAELGYFLTHKSRVPTNSLHCTSGLSLLLASYKSYSFALPDGSSPSSSRVQALRFAQECQSTLKTALADEDLFPCRCRQTLGFHLERLQGQLESYLGTKMFDLYFQSPWVCGSQMLEMSQAMNYYGLRLLAYKNCVGTVLHMYNVLRQMHDIPSIPLLDAYCDKDLSELFFPGGKPTKRFCTSYTRYQGGRLSFHRKGGTNHQNGCHELVIPDHTWRATVGLSHGEEVEGDARFDCGKWSGLFRTRQQDYHCDHGLDAMTSPRKRAVSGSTCRSSGLARRYESLIEGFDEIRGLVDQELRSEFPVAKLNHFAMLGFCARIVHRLYDDTHDPKRPRKLCYCFAQDLLSAADGCREGKGWRVRKDVRELVESCRTAIIVELGGKNVDDCVFTML